MESLMSSKEKGNAMEGWLYLIRCNRIGLQYSTKRYFVLQNHLLKSFKSIPLSLNEVPIRSAIIDSCIRVTDDGRESIHRKEFFIFTLYNNSNHIDKLKLGASSPEDAARWIHSFQESALKDGQNFVGCSKNYSPSYRLRGSRHSRQSKSIDWTTFSSTQSDLVTDVIAPSMWKIFGCQNGLRIFKEKDSQGMWDDHPAIMAVDVVDGSSEEIFQTLMSLGHSRSEWDFCFFKGSVVEHLDGHNDIIHKQLSRDWLPWGIKRRDLLLHRYWRREDDGTYVILYHSVVHKKCPPQKGYVRACLKSGGYVVSPMNHGLKSVLKHMLAVDWKFWRSYIRSSAARSVTIRMLGRVAALRELFRAKQGDCPAFNYFSGDPPIRTMLHQNEEDGKNDIQILIDDGNIKENINEEIYRTPSGQTSLMGLNDTDDEFFDVPEPSEFEHRSSWSYDFGPETFSQDSRQQLKSAAAGIVKKLHDYRVQKRGYVDLQEAAKEDSISCCYGSTLPKDFTCSQLSTWAMADASTFLIRGPSYLQDQKKVKATSPLMQMVAADWLKSDKREDDLASRPGSIVQKSAAEGEPEFFLIINIQVPGSTMYSLALYYMMTKSMKELPMLERFINGDDAYRNSRFKLIPYISKGSWIVKQSVGKKACLIGQALDIHYFQGKNYLELDVDIGSSTVARGVVNLVLGYLSNLVIEMAFLIQANTNEELPETLLGTCRLNHLDASKAVSMS